MLASSQVDLLGIAAGFRCEYLDRHGGDVAGDARRQGASSTAGQERHSRFAAVLALTGFPTLPVRGCQSPRQEALPVDRRNRRLVAGPPGATTTGRYRRAVEPRRIVPGTTDRGDIRPLNQRAVARVSRLMPRGRRSARGINAWRYAPDWLQYMVNLMADMPTMVVRRCAVRIQVNIDGT